MTTRGLNYWESKDRPRPPSVLLRQSRPPRHRRPDRQADHDLRRQRRASTSRRASAAIPKTLRLVQSHHARARLRRHADPRLGHQPGLQLRRPAISAPSTSAPANSSGPSTPSRIPASSATTPGRRTRGRRSAASTSGASSRSTRSAASSTRPPPVRNTTSTAPIARAPISSATRLLALDARTGKRLWHFQMVHHDIWDYDDATAPKLLTVKHDGKTVDVVAQVSKQGFIWVFNRVTGEPLWPIEERPVPKSDMPEEEAWPTQPFPTAPPPFARQKFTVDDLSPYLSPEDRAALPRRDAERPQRGPVHASGHCAPTVQMPGNNGGANWGGAAVDPANGKLYVVSKDLPAMLKLERDKAAPDTVRYVSGFNFMIASDGLSPIAPPWSSLTAYDLNTGTISWKIPLGDAPGKQEYRVPLPQGRPGRDRHRPDFHGHARQADPRARRRYREGPLAETARHRAGRHPRGLRSRRARVHRVLRRRAVRPDARHRGEAQRVLRRFRAPRVIDRAGYRPISIFRSMAIAIARYPARFGCSLSPGPPAVLSGTNSGAQPAGRADRPSPCRNRPPRRTSPTSG